MSHLDRLDHAMGQTGHDRDASVFRAVADVGALMALSIYTIAYMYQPFGID